jgi:hypothetical protein
MTTESPTDAFTSDAFICLGQRVDATSDPLVAATAANALHHAIAPRSESDLYIERPG